MEATTNESVGSVHPMKFTTFLESPLPGMQDFVGIYMDEDRSHPTVYLPHGFPPVQPLNLDRIRRDLTTFFRALQRSKKALRAKGNTGIVISSQHGCMFGACIRVIEDFLHHGEVLEPKRSLQTSGAGRTDWARTLRKQRALLTEQGSVYLVPLKHHVIHTEQRIAHIQMHCLGIADRLIGWMFNRASTQHQTWTVSQIVEAIQFIRKKLQSTYNNRMTALFTDFLMILDEERLQQSSGIYRPLGLENGMEDVWEEIVDSIFGNKSAKNFAPRAVRVRTCGSQEESSGLRPDTVRVVTNEGDTTSWVIDAKYYGPGREPKTSDVNKQVTYGDWVENKLAFHNPSVYNLFILPSFLNDVGFEHDGYSSMGPLENPSKKHHRVHFYKVDTISLMRAYLRDDSTLRDGICYDVMNRG